jgi:hypothetical protein
MHDSSAAVAVVASFPGVSEYGIPVRHLGKKMGNLGIGNRACAPTLMAFASDETLQMLKYGGGVSRHKQLERGMSGHSRPRMFAESVV